MIDIKDFPLSYFCRETGKAFKGKTLIQGELVSVINLESGEVEKLSLYKLKIRFKSDPENKKRGQRSRMSKPKFHFGSEYDEYLDENRYESRTVISKSS